MNFSVFMYALLIILTAWGGYLAKSLSKSGAIATVLIGFAVAVGFGLKGLLLLGIFFLSSSFWSKFKSSQKKHVEEKLEKGDSRDWTQVFANGGVAGAVSFIYYFYPSDIFLMMFLAAIASANSDTWASEIGVLSRRQPVYILSLRTVDKGTSGAVSLLGSIAAILAALLIGISSIIFFDLTISWLILVTIFGFLGNLFDTVLGALYQAKYKCNACGIETEKQLHCGRPTMLIKGTKLLNNDLVNALSIFLASLLAAAVYMMLKNYSF
ncbi:DUF92 domain-containing protein [Peribacillus sp. SCS-155]|uniref:DUF92 domain-containing protein n=1 Tax=Peribacillus sedimenti TaxID=3115297 RepID=UPI003905B4B5